MSFYDDVAMRILKEFEQRWDVEADRVQWGRVHRTDGGAGGLGFVWAPGDQRLSVTAMPGAMPGAEEAVKVAVRTAFLKNVAFHTEACVLAADTVARTASCFSFAYMPPRFGGRLNAGVAPSGSDLWLSASAYMTHENFEWLTDLLIPAAAVQPSVAFSQSEIIMRALGSGVLDDFELDPAPATLSNNIIGYTPYLMRHSGREASRFADTGAFERISTEHQRLYGSFASAGADGLTLQTPFGSENVWIRFSTNEPHPLLGHGLRASMSLPWFGRALDIAHEAAELNFLESVAWTGFPQLGCWHGGPVLAVDQTRPASHGVCYTSFTPNVLYKDGLLSALAHWLSERAHWALALRYDEARVWESLKVSMGAASDPIRP